MPIMRLSLRTGALHLPDTPEPLEISWSRPIPADAKINSITISKDTVDRYFISIHFEADWQPFEEIQTAVGISWVRNAIQSLYAFFSGRCNIYECLTNQNHF